jgi:hypothetical protein
MARRIRDAQGPVDDIDCNSIAVTGGVTAATATNTTSHTTAARLTTTNVGTVTTPATTTAAEYGDGVDHLTVLTLTDFVVGTSGDNASLGFGAKFYTWPVGPAILCDAVTIAGGLTAAISVTTDTPEVGIGSVVATGAVATLSTATWENYVDGGAAGGTGDADTVAPDVAGTAFYKCNLSTVRPIIQPTGGLARDLFLNVADGWADVDAAGAVTFTGVITLKWRIIN